MAALPVIEGCDWLTEGGPTCPCNPCQCRPENQCAPCDGTGRIQPYPSYETTCWDCNGKGVI